jgi:hypothetical protein
MARLRAAVIHGYSDRLSVAPGERIEFKVSSEEPGTYRADIVRLIHGDTNPAGPGFKEQVIAKLPTGVHFRCLRIGLTQIFVRAGPVFGHFPDNSSRSRA